MHVPSPEAVRAPPTVHGSRKRSLALPVLAAAAFGFAPQAAQGAPKALSKSTIVAPTTLNPLKGTLRGSRCRLRFGATAKSVKITVTGPLGSKKPKSHKLKVKGSKKATCVWNTRSVVDGSYRFAARAHVKAGGHWYVITMKRTVQVRNRITARIAGATGEGPQYGVGNTRYVGRLETQWDTYLSQSPSVIGPFMRQHMWETVVQSPFFDNKISWSPPALAYKDLYAIYRTDTVTQQAHPEWILKDAFGQPMSIPWGCQPGPCPQFAGDIGSPSFRAAWIAQAKATMTKGYHGLWIDDVNMEMRIGNAAGADGVPIDPRTSAPMTFSNWRRYIAEFLEEIRAQIPHVELDANVLWFGGTSIGRDADPYVQRAYSAVDRLNLERGFNDDGLTGGSAPRDIWSVDTFMQFIDRMHDRGIPVTLDSETGLGRPGWEYNLAGYFLVDTGKDALAELQLAPGDWWSGWDVKLGAAKSDRSRRSDGVFTRSFSKGVVYLNPPKAKTITITLPHSYRRIDGSVVTSITLPPSRGAVLQTP